MIKNFNVSKNRILKIPFLPYITDNLDHINNDLKKKYRINENYFIICNRFWKHKNHNVVFEAFSKFVKSKKNYQLVCTGDITDTRDPYYFGYLQRKYKNLINSNKIKILGLISRADQLNLLKNAKAVIQPTLYEGGPGGFSSYEAIAYQKPLILSNISINREIKYKKAKFFDPKSPNSLLSKLNKISLEKKNNLSLKNLKKKSNSNKIKLGKFLFKSIDLTVKAKKSNFL